MGRRAQDSDISSDVDPDVDLHDPLQRAEIRPREWDLLLVIAVGGIVGAEARYGLAQLIPHTDAAWPWATLVTNSVGSLLLGVLMVLLGAAAAPHRFIRPFVGVGVLGGFTTFSTYAVDAYRLLLAHRPFVAMAYVGATLLACLIGVAAAQPVTRATLLRGRR